jgi:hypothetical protein
MSAEHKAQLDHIGFDWGKEVTTNLIKWEHRFQELLEYKKIHGDFKASRKIGVNKQLAVWIMAQRKMKWEGKLCVEREAILDSIGFNWEKHDGKEWDLCFQDLREYLQAYGDCNVPDSYFRNPRLAYWVAKQRLLFQQKVSGEKTSLTALHEAKLDAVGFIWIKDSAINDVCADQVTSESRADQVTSESQDCVVADHD